jgi:hypothetical protein
MPTPSAGRLIPGYLSILPHLRNNGALERPHMQIFLIF